MSSSLTSDILEQNLYVPTHESGGQRQLDILSRRWKERDRPILAYGLMLFAAVSLVLNYFIKFPTLPDETAASFREYLDKRLSLQIETNDARTLERYFEARGVFFRMQIQIRPHTR